MRCFFTLCSLLPAVLCAYTNTQLQLVAAASESASASYSAKGAVPATGGTVAQSSSYTHYSGDAAGYILQPAAQRDGVAYEWLADNDADSLSDAIEVGLGSNLYAADTDADGLTDAEEYLTHGTSLLHADTDFDGSLDPDELLAGTSPTDASSRFVANIQAAANGRLSLAWFAVAGRDYLIESAASPAGPWSSYAPFTFPGSDTLLEIEFSPSETEGKAFYRVIIE